LLCGVALILFVLDLKIYLNGLENKCKKREKRKSLPAAGGLENRPDRPVSLSREWAELSRAFPFFPHPRGPAQSRCSSALPPSLVSLTGGTRRSAASSLSVRNRAGVMVPTERNPELHEILFQAKVSWDYLSKP
jgi:hypothetical protein